MPFPGQAWPLNLKVVATVCHALAIVSGIFRSTYRLHISRFGWDDAWALLALVTDIGCLVCAWVEHSSPLNLSKTDIVQNWASMITLNSVPWEARLSMITSVIRITNPRPSARRVSYAIAITFGMMWITVLAEKLYECVTRSCTFKRYVVISQVLTDGISDALLVSMPIYLLKGFKIPRNQRVLLISSFASSIGITILSIAQSVSLLMPITPASLLFTHIKAALSAVICNLLVVVTFVYQCYRKTDLDLGRCFQESDPVQLTTVVPEELNEEGCTCATSLQQPCPLCTTSP